MRDEIGTLIKWWVTHAKDLEEKLSKTNRLIDEFLSAHDSYHATVLTRDIKAGSVEWERRHAALEAIREYRG